MTIPLTCLVLNLVLCDVASVSGNTAFSLVEKRVVEVWGGECVLFFVVVLIIKLRL